MRPFSRAMRNASAREGRTERTRTTRQDTRRRTQRSARLTTMDKLLHASPSSRRFAEDDEEERHAQNRGEDSDGDLDAPDEHARDIVDAQQIRRP